MKFERVPTDQALGGLLAHRHRGSGFAVDKGTELTQPIIAQLLACGVEALSVVRLEAGDLPEAAAAKFLLDGLSGPQLLPGEITRGRGNLYAATDGLFLCDAGAIDRFNAIDESITLATLRPNTPVAAGQLVATAKIIPFGAPAAAVQHATQQLCKLELAPFRSRSVCLIQTDSGLLKPSALEKAEQVMLERLSKRGIGEQLVTLLRVPHRWKAVASALRSNPADLYILLGESAISDRGDVLPAGIYEAGGQVVHFGLPVDPGNLLLLGRLGGNPIIAAPGCARAPTDNGFDFVLDRVLADLPVDARDLTALGVGGLLKEDSDARLIARSRDKPAVTPLRSKPKIAALLLAAGFGTRMVGTDKLALASAGNRSILEQSASAYAPVSPKLLVHREAQPRSLSGWKPVVVKGEAPQLSDSLRAGMTALPTDIDAVLVGLGDMPEVSQRTIQAMIVAFNPDEGVWAVRPSHEGTAGNPVLIGRRFFEKLNRLTGDRGARTLLEAQSHLVLDLPVDDPGILRDLDDRAAYEAYLERAT